MTRGFGHHLSAKISRKLYDPYLNSPNYFLHDFYSFSFLGLMDSPYVRQLFVELDGQEANSF